MGRVGPHKTPRTSAPQRNCAAQHHSHAAVGRYTTENNIRADQDAIDNARGSLKVAPRMSFGAISAAAARGVSHKQVHLISEYE